MREEISFCRICSGQCGVRLTLDDANRVVKVRGDKDHPLTRGYACIKGVANHELHNSPERLLQPMKRMPDGGYMPIGLEQALDEIALRVADLREESGPRSIAAFVGTWGFNNAALAPTLKGFMDALGSPSRFTSLTVDQSAKIVTIGRMGRWSAGRQSFADADAWMIFGGNPLVSVANTTGVPANHPLKQLQDAKARGMKLIVVDPRKTETAAFADVHVQNWPGSDPAIAAGMLRIMLEEGLADTEFCTLHVTDMAALAEAIAPFTTDAVEALSGVPGAQLRAAARLWGGAGKRGCAYTSTGPCMSGFSNLADHMVELLNVVGGRYLRAGERIDNGLSVGPRRAEALPPSRWWESGAGARVGAYGALPGIIGRELPCGVLSDEILTPGEGRIRALFVVGGNPALSFPDQRKVVQALKALDLLVTIDPFMSATARLADYVIPPLMQFERPDSIPVDPLVDLLPYPFLQVTPAIASPPAGAEVIDDWYLFWALAQRLGLQLSVFGAPVDMETPPTTRALIDRILALRDVPLDDLWQARRGLLFEDRQRTVEPGKRPGKLTAMAPDVAAELAAFAAQGGPKSDARFTHLLASRRMREAMNSVHHESPSVRARHAFNPLYIHPDDMAALSLQAGDMVEIRSEHGAIAGKAEPDAALKRGVVQMAHAWGDLPEEAEDYAARGANTGRLISNTLHVQTINAMARQSGVPVNIRRAD